MSYDDNRVNSPEHLIARIGNETEESILNEFEKILSDARANGISEMDSKICENMIK